MTPPDRRPPCAYSPDPDRPRRPPVLALIVVFMAAMALITASAIVFTTGGVMINPDHEETNP